MMWRRSWQNILTLLLLYSAAVCFGFSSQESFFFCNVISIGKVNGILTNDIYYSVNLIFKTKLNHMHAGHLLAFWRNKGKAGVDVQMSKGVKLYIFDNKVVSDCLKYISIVVDPRHQIFLRLLTFFLNCLLRSFFCKFRGYSGCFKLCCVIGCIMAWSLKRPTVPTFKDSPFS